MRIKSSLQAALPDLVVVLGFLLISYVYFLTPLSHHWVLGGHDVVAGVGLGQEQAQHLAAFGERSRWTNSIFSGMPTYQIAPSYGSTDLLSKIGLVWGLFTTGVLNYLFLYLLGFYLLMRTLGNKQLLSAFGSVAWAFSSYFFIIIAAGHIWKVNTLAFVPPTIAGLIMVYRGRYLWGGLTLALFTALQVLSNHIQMTYYFLFVMGFIALAYSIDALRTKRWAHLAKATATVLVGGALGALINLSNLYHTWEYSQHSTRGKSELSAQPKAGAAASTSGLDRDYITAWSYGIDETITLCVANFKGGGSGENLLDAKNAKLGGYDSLSGYTSQLGLSQLPAYWGDQPMTVGPVYVGAIICFLALFALLWVRGPLKWALLAATLLSLLFAWGRNWMAVTDFFIDHLPMYAKFRTVSSALVVAEFTLPLLAMLGLAELFRLGEAELKTRRLRLCLGVSFGAFALLTLGLALGLVGGDVSSTNDAPLLSQLSQIGAPAEFVSGFTAALYTLRQSLLAQDAWRSFWLIAVAAALLAAYARWSSRVPKTAVVGVLLLLTLGDMWLVNRRYLNNESFSPEAQLHEGFTKTPADETILADKGLDYRVLNLSLGNPFNETTNQTAYYHKSIGGYHPAKPRRYQELIDRYLNPEIERLSTALSAAQQRVVADSLHFAARGITDQSSLWRAVVAEAQLDRLAPTLAMLNAKWFVLSKDVAIANPAAMGNAWFVRDVRYVPNADAELAALATTDLRQTAIVDQRWAAEAGATTSDTGRVVLTSYAANALSYRVESAKGGVVVFSESFYPGWTVTIDGRPAELFCTNYVLRGLRVPAGSHEVKMSFRPVSLAATEAMANAALALLALGFAFALWRLRAEGPKADQAAYQQV